MILNVQYLLFVSTSYNGYAHLADENWPRITINPMLSTSKLNAKDLDLALLDEMFTLLNLSIIVRAKYCERERRGAG